MNLATQISFVNNVRATETHLTSVTAILDGIRNGEWRAQVEGVRQAYVTGGKDAANELKKNLPAVLFSGIFSTRKATAITEHSGRLVLDLDNLGESLESARALVMGDPHTLACFISPTGTGLKVLVRIPADPAKHLASFRSVEAYYRVTLGLTIDPACKDVCRLCYVSFDPHLFVNQEAVPFEVPTSAAAALPPMVAPQTMSRQESLSPDFNVRYTNDVVVGQGQRNAHLFRRAGLMRHFNFSPAAIFEALKIENQQCCNPPLPEAEVQRIAESVERYPVGAAGGQNGFLSECRSLPAPVNAATWMQEQLPAPDPILNGAFDAGTKAQVVGASKSRKSYFLLQMVLCLAAGSRCFLEWIIPRARRVLFLNLEITPAHFQLRLRRMLTALGLTSESMSDRLLIHNLRGQQLGADFFDQLATLVREHHIELLVIDPVYKLISGDESAQPEIKRILRQIDHLCVETGCAVLYSHHTAKGVAGDRQAIDRASGSGVLARDFDAQIGIVEHAEPQLLVCEQIARSYPPKDAFCIEWIADRGLFVVRKTPAIVRTSRNRPANGRVGRPLTDDDAIAVVALQPKVAGQFHAALRGLGFTEAQARAAKDRLLEEGRLRSFCPPVYPRRVIIGTPEQIANLRTEGCKTGVEDVS